MIHAIGAMHTALRANKRLKDKTLVEEKRPPTQREDRDDERPRRDSKTRGQRV